LQYKGEIELIRGSRQELLADLAAIGQFLDERRGMQKKTAPDAVKKAEDILNRRAA
jgi:hypothetical protein